MTLKRRCQTAAATVFAASLLAAPAFAAEGDNVGETQMCIDSNLIYDTPVIDDKTILVRMRGPKKGYKRIDLVQSCAGLTPGRGFAYGSALTKLCKQDILTVLDAGGARCIIDKIVTIDEAEAKELMKK